MKVIDLGRGRIRQTFEQAGGQTSVDTLTAIVVHESAD